MKRKKLKKKRKKESERKKKWKRKKDLFSSPLVLMGGSKLSRVKCVSVSFSPCLSVILMLMGQEHAGNNGKDAYWAKLASLTDATFPET